MVHFVPKWFWTDCLNISIRTFQLQSKKEKYNRKLKLIDNAMHILIWYFVIHFEYFILKTFMNWNEIQWLYEMKSVHKNNPIEKLLNPLTQLPLLFISPLNHLQTVFTGGSHNNGYFHMQFLILASFGYIYPEKNSQFDWIIFMTLPIRGLN